jgi:hypothetical protein
MLTVTEVARRLPRHLRGQYLQTVANLLSEVVVGDASVHRAAHRAMQMVEISAWQNQRRGLAVIDGTGDDGTNCSHGNTLKSPRQQFEAMAASNPKFKEASGDIGVVIGGARPAK